MSWFNYEDYLRISDEIDFNKVATKVEISLITINHQIDRYDEEACNNRLYELNQLIYDLMEIEARAAIHKHGEIFDKCCIYYADINHLMRRLVDKLNS